MPISRSPRRRTPVNREQGPAPERSPKAASDEAQDLPRSLPTPRLLDRDGTTRIRRVGAGRAPFQDAYHGLLVMKWRWLLLLVATSYVLINVVFAMLYLAGGQCIRGARPDHFGDAFFFSIQTFSTIGYGHMSPDGTWANALVVVEAIVGMIAVAVVTGLTFAKVSRPTSRIIFSDKAIFTQYEGQPALMVRMANARGNQVVEASVRLTVLMDAVTAEGEVLRRLVDLPLVRAETPVFALSWLVIHRIDERSPLHGHTRDSLDACSTHLLASLAGTDDDFQQPVHARRVWGVGEMAWGKRFADIIVRHPDGSREIDFRRFDVLEDRP